MRLIRFFLLFATCYSLAGLGVQAGPAVSFAKRMAPAAGAAGDTAQVVHLLKLAERNFSSKPDSALQCATQALTLARRQHLPRQEAEALEYSGWVHYVRGDYQGSLRLYQQALSVAQAVGYAREGAVLHAYIGTVLQAEGAYPEALANNLAALRYYAAVHDTARLAFSIRSVASVEYYDHHYARAIAYYQQAIQLLKKINRQRGLNVSYQGLAIVYLATGELDQAERYFQLGLAYFRREKDRTNESIALNNLGDVYTKQKKYALAQRFFAQALALAEANQDVAVTAACCTGLAQLLYQQGQYAQAQAYARRGLTLAEGINALPVAKEACLVLASALAAQRRFEPALGFYKQGKVLEDSLFSIEHTAQLDALRGQYQEYRRGQEEAAHRYRIRQLERDQHISHLTLLLVLGVGLSLVVFAWLGWRQSQATRQHNRAQKQAEQAEQAARQAAEQAEQAAKQAAERVAQLLNEARLQQAEFELGLKDRKLASLALAAMEKGEFLHEVKERLDVIARTADEDVSLQLGRLRLSIENNGSSNKDWEQFRVIFEDVHPNFFAELQRQFPEVTPNDLRLAALLRLNFSSKSMAGLMGISTESVKTARYRLRQKLQLSTAANLVEFMMRLDAESLGGAGTINGED